ncbi:MAG: GNA1162 family protein [Endomicrobiales bacterium]|jgi:hypothetical protein
MNKSIVLVLLSLCVTLFTSSCGTQQSIIVKPGFDFSTIKRVAVLNFDDAPSFPNSGAVPAELFTKYLLKTGFSVIERTQIDSILKEHQLFLSGIIDPTQVKEFGKIAGVDAIIVGSISEYVPEQNLYEGDYQRFIAAQVGLTCRMISVETGEVLWVGSDTYDGDNTQTAFEYLISSLVNELMKTLVKNH